MIRKEGIFEEILELTIQEKTMSGCISDSATVSKSCHRISSITKARNWKAHKLTWNYHVYLSFIDYAVIGSWLWQSIYSLSNKKCKHFYVISKVITSSLTKVISDEYNRSIRMCIILKPMYGSKNSRSLFLHYFFLFESS